VAAAVLVAAACAGDTAAGLRITRADGSRVAVAGGVRAWCGPTRGEATDELTGPRGLYVLGGRLPGDDEQDPGSFWIFTRRETDLARATELSLPVSSQRETALFVLDAPRHNELSSAQEQASGTIEVEEWGCERGDDVRLSVDATLDSESFGAPSVRVEGTVETEVGDAPPQSD
jgi:hypothetical protein